VGTEREAKLREFARLLSVRMDEVRSATDMDSHKRSFRTFADQVPAIIWTARADGEVTYFNQHYYTFFGVDHLRWGELIHPDDRELCFDRWATAVNTGRPYEHSSRFLGADREYHQIVTRAQPVHGDSGAVSYWIGSSAIVEELARPALQVVA
jgi:PAS domain-containing protein